MNQYEKNNFHQLPTYRKVELICSAFMTIAWGSAGFVALAIILILLIKGAFS